MYAIVFQFSRVCGIREDTKMVVAVGVCLQLVIACFRGFVVSVRILQNGRSNLGSLLTEGCSFHFETLSQTTKPSQPKIKLSHRQVPRNAVSVKRFWRTFFLKGAKIKKFWEAFLKRSEEYALLNSHSPEDAADYSTGELG